MQRYLFVVKKVCAWRLFFDGRDKKCMLTVCFQCEFVLVGAKLKTGNTKKMDNFPKLPISYEKKTNYCVCQSYASLFTWNARLDFMLEALFG